MITLTEKKRVIDGKIKALEDERDKLYMLSVDLGVKISKLQLK